MAGKRIAGICFIKMDGEQLEVKGGIECPVTDNVKETQMGSNAPAGYSEMAQRPYVKGSFFFLDNFPIEKLSTANDLTVTAELANGKTYVLSEAWVEGEVPAKNDDGTVDLEFSGMKGQWQ